MEADFQSIFFNQVISVETRGGQIWHFRGLVTRLFEALPVKIWLWNLAHRLRRPNEALGIFLGLDHFWWLQSNSLACLFWATGKTYIAKILQEASLIQYRTSEFNSAWLFNWLSINFDFSRKSRNYTISLIRLLRIFFRFQEKLMKYIKSSFHNIDIWGN